MKKALLRVTMLDRFGRTRNILSGAIIAACCVGLAFGQSECIEQKSPRDPLAALFGVPESARARINPFAGDSREQTAGGKLFLQHCAHCHGEKAGGTRRGPSLWAPAVQQAPPGTLFWIITNGVVRRGMPVWSKLPPQQRWQIVTFIQSLRSMSKNAAHEPN